MNGGEGKLLAFGDFLKNLMDIKEVGVNELANLSGVSAAHISRIINGKRPAPGPKTIKKFASALNTDYNELMRIAGHFSDSLPEPKKPKDLLKILEQEDYTLNGQIATQADKERLKKLVEVMYWDAKAQNKRK